MALFLVLKDFSSGVAGAPEFISAATILDSTLVNTAGLQTAGCPMLPWTATAPQVAARNAFLSRTQPGAPIYSENLLDLLATFGAFGGGGVSGAVEEFTFRPGAVDNPTMGIYGTWASLMAEVAIPAAVGISLTIVVDYSVSLANFLIPAGTWNFGGLAILTGIPFQGFSLQADAAVTKLVGIARLDNGLTLEAVGAGAAAPIDAPLGLSVLEMTRGAIIFSSNAAGRLIDVPVGATLLIFASGGSVIAKATSPAVGTAGAGAALFVAVLDTSLLGNNSLAGAAGGIIAIEKGSPESGIPTTLAGFAGYPASVDFTLLPYSLPHAFFGVQTVPLAAGVYFLQDRGNDAVVVATAQDVPFREPATYGTGIGVPHRLLATAIISAVLNAAVAAVVTVEILVNGVLVPGMTAANVDLNTIATTPRLFTATNPLLLLPFDAISVRITVPGGGIAATATDIFCTVEAG